MRDPSVEDFLTEVENDIRQEKYMKLWNQYGRQVSYGLGAVLAVVAMITAWNSYQHSKLLRDSEMFEGIQDFLAQDKVESARTALKSFNPSNRTYQMLAEFSMAATYLSEKYRDPAKAIEMFQKIADNTGYEAQYRHLARINAISVQLDDGKRDNLELQLKKVNDLLGDKDLKTFRALALELKGFILAELGQTAEAGEVLTEVGRDTDASEGVIRRATMLAQALGAASTKETQEKKS